MTDDKETQKKYFELQMLNQKAMQIHQQLEMLDGQIIELDKVSEGLSEFKYVEKGSEVYVPFSAGIFAKAILENPEELLVNVGSGVTVKKSIDEVRELIETQTGDLRDVQAKLTQQMTDLNVKAHQVEKELQNVQVS